MFGKIFDRIWQQINPENIKRGDTVELLSDFFTGADVFSKGEKLEVVGVSLAGIDLEDKQDDSRWVTDVSFREVRKVNIQ